MNVLWSSIVIDALIAAGVRDLVISPGSRSTPLTLAAIDSELKLFSIIDERQAGFFALGRAQESARPVALLCTSGSAGAHYLPALLEARYSHIPLIAITADRPRHLQHCSAPQTIDQNDLLGSAVRSVVHFGQPNLDTDSLRGLRRQVIQGVRQTRHPIPGPVHMNAAFKKPLEPQELDHDAQAQQLRQSLASLPNVSATHALPKIASEQIDYVAEQIQRSKRGLITLGPSIHASVTAKTLRRLKHETGFELYCDITSNIRQSLSPDGYLSCLDPVSRANLPSPSLVLQIGTPVISSAIAAWTKESERIVFADHGWPDATNRASMIQGDVEEGLNNLCDALSSSHHLDSEWAKQLRAACAQATEASGAIQEGEAAIIQKAFEAMPSHTCVLLGNSLVVRVADTFVHLDKTDIEIRSQRGVSGIDGLIARASGHSLEGDRRFLLMVGDVSFAHDANALCLAEKYAHNLDILVIDNSGGQIFAHLPLSSTDINKKDFSDYWLTPPQINPQGLAHAYGIEYIDINEQNIGQSIRHKSHTQTRILHAKVPPQGAQSAWNHVMNALK